MYVINYSEFLLHAIQVFVANIGDAKAVVARSSTTDGSENHSDGASQLKAIVLTREHKAIYPQERARIQKVSCIVLFSLILFYRMLHVWSNNYRIVIHMWTARFVC